MAKFAILASLATTAPLVEASGTMSVTWADCGDSSTHAKVNDLQPSSIAIGTASTLTGTGTVDKDVSGGEFKLNMKASFIKKTWTGDICQPKTFSIPLGLGTVKWDGMKCPVAKGQANVPIDVQLSSSIPASMATADISGSATTSNGDKLLCMNVHLKKASENEGELDGKTLINNEDLISYYNSQNGATWVAGHNEFFNGMTFDDARVLLGTDLSHISEHLKDTRPDSVYATLGEAPAEFDASKQWPGLIHPIRNQERCGSCWAFSASEVMSDRVAIATGKPSPVLSAEDMVSCDKNDGGCQGGQLPYAWDYITGSGLLTDACFPYTAGGGTEAACETKCVDGSAFSRTKASSSFAVNGNSNLQKELMTNGPIQVAFKVYKSFMSYKSGVYQKSFWEFTPEGGHAVKFTGWGTEDGSDYWLVANSWGTGWGLDGFFKISRGNNECGIETMGPPYAGLYATSSAVVV